MTFHKRATAALLLAGTAAVTSACSFDPQLPDTAKPAAQVKSDQPAKAKVKAPAPKDLDEKAVVAVINRFHRAVDAGDGKRACAELSKNLQGVYALNPGSSDCASGIEYTSKQLGDGKMTAMRLAPSDVEVKGKEAVVSHVLIAKRNGTKAAETDSYNMVRAGGGWKIDYVG